ncbi:hypothetical protein ABFT51_14115 [Paenibacillus peoriae]|uniref:hypothetical protein n=1 Tax=Paenibacillus peoriae TaxID=59893 RepID=UPI0032AFECF5
MILKRVVLGLMSLASVFSIVTSANAQEFKEQSSLEKSSPITSLDYGRPSETRNYYREYELGEVRQIIGDTYTIEEGEGLVIVERSPDSINSFDVTPLATGYVEIHTLDSSGKIYIKYHITITE